MKQRQDRSSFRLNILTRRGKCKLANEVKLEQVSERVKQDKITVVTCLYILLSVFFVACLAFRVANAKLKARLAD